MWLFPCKGSPGTHQALLALILILSWEFLEENHGCSF